MGIDDCGLPVCETVQHGYGRFASGARPELHCYIGCIQIVPIGFLVDVSMIVNNDLNSGIQRVTGEILNSLLIYPPHQFRVEPIYRRGGNYYYAREYIHKKYELEDDFLVDQPVETHKGDVFLGLDLDIDFREKNGFDYLRYHRNRGLKIFYVVYDVLPIVMSDCFPDLVAKFYKQWFDFVSDVADGLVCISKSVSNEVTRLTGQLDRPPLNQPKISHFYLGCNFHNDTPDHKTSNSAGEIQRPNNGSCAFLVVGTIEPRKGHAQILGAMEALWKNHSEDSLVLIGKAGWGVEDLVKKIRMHRELGKRLIWIDDADDETLRDHYRFATALIMASQGEGFGLPIVEASCFGVPVIVRDIPVFREICQDNAFYFEGNSVEHFAQALEKWKELFRHQQHPKSEGIQKISWDASADQLTDTILDNE